MVFWFLSVKEVSSAFCCFSQHSSPWKDLSGRKSSTRSPLCPWIFELAVFLLALGTPCSLSLQGQIMDTVVLLMRCRAWTSLQVSKIFSSITSADEPKMLLCAFYLLSFPFHFFFPSLCCEDDSTAGIPDPFFPAFLLTAVLTCFSTFTAQPWLLRGCLVSGRSHELLL